MSVLYVQTSGTHQVNYGAPPSPIPGLSLTLPRGAGETALVTLNVPNSKAGSGAFGDQTGGWFGISVDGKTMPTVATYTYVIPMTGNPGRVPTTLAIGVPLAETPQKIVALWQATGQYLAIDSPASLSALL